MAITVATFLASPSNNAVIIDTYANIYNNLARLTTLSSSYVIYEIKASTVASGPVAYSTYLSNTFVFDSMLIYGLSLPISCLAADFQAAKARYWSGPVNFAITDTASNIVSKSGTFGGITNNLVTISSVNVVDSESSISNNFSALVGLATSITVTSSDAPIRISDANLHQGSYQILIGKISGTYTLAITDVPTINLISDLNFGQYTSLAGHVVSVAIVDTAQNIYSNISSLQTNAAKVASVTVVDTSANIASYLDRLQSIQANITGITQTSVAPLAITATQLTSDSVILGKIAGAYSLNVSGVTTSAMASTLANSNVASVAISDTSANIASNLDALQANVAKISSVNQTFQAPLAITAAQLVSDSAIINKISGYYSLAVSGVSAGSAVTTLSNINISSISISDTSANIAANLDALFPYIYKITSITQTSVAPLAITVTQLVNDISVLNKISGSYSLAVSGTSASIASNIDAIQSSSSNIASITQTSVAPLAITATQLVNDISVLNKISGSYSLVVTDAAQSILANMTSIQSNASNISSVVVSDSAANIASNLDALQANVARIGSIVQTGSPALLSVTTAQVTNDAGALSKISGPYYLNVSAATVADISGLYSNTHVSSIAITDSSANIFNGLSSINSNYKISSIAQTDAGTPYLISASQAANYANVFSKFSGSYVINISDTSANIATYLNEINTVCLFYHGGTITQTGTTAPLTLTVSQFINDLTALNKFTNAYSINLVDSSSNIAANLDWLVSHLSSINNIAFSGATQPLELSATQVVSGNALLQKISSSYSINVSDSIANIASNINFLQSKVASINSITLTSGAAAPASITASQYLADTAVINKISGSYSLTLTGTGITVSNLSATLANSNVVGLTVTDTSANIAAGMDQLQSNVGLIISITQSGTVSALSLSALQVNNDAQAIGKIAGTYSINVSDTSANIATSLDALQSKIAKINSITQTGTLAPLAITVGQMTSDASALAKIAGGNYTLAVSGVSVANVATMLTTSKVATISVSDTYSNISANLPYLTGLSGLVTGITIADTGLNISKNLDAIQLINAQLSGLTITDGVNVFITASQLTSDAGVLSKINGGTYLVSVVDTATNISSNINALEAAVTAGHIAGITTLDSAPISVTASQMTADADALALIKTNIYSRSTLEVFPGQNGLGGGTSQPLGALVIDGSGNLYGAAATGGTNFGSTIYQLGGPAYQTQNLFLLNSVSLLMGVVSDSAGNIYGYSNNSGTYTVYQWVKSTQTINALHSFSSASPLSGYTLTGDLFLDSAGNVYGRTAQGGANSRGLIYELSGTNKQTLTTLYNFTASSGSNPIVVDSSGNVYGIYGPSSNWAFYKITNSTKAITISSQYFGSASLNTSSLMMDSSGNIFIESGTQILKFSSGSILNSVFTVVATLSAANGSNFYGALKMDGAGNLYGVTQSGGAYGFGTIFEYVVSTNSVITRYNFTSNNLLTDVTYWNPITVDSAGNIFIPVQNGGGGASGPGAIYELSANTNSGAYTLNVSQVRAADVVTTLANNKVASISVADTAANLAVNITALQTKIANISAISATDNQTMSLTLSQVINNLGVITKLNHAVNVTDSSANISSAIATLQSYALSGLSPSGAIVSSITQTDPATPLALSYSALTQSTNALGILTNQNYTVNVSGVSVANTASLLSGNAHVASIAINDSCVNIANGITSNLDMLQSNVAKISAITTTDSLPIAVSLSQITSDAAILAKINGGGYTLWVVSGVNTANAASVIAGNNKIASVVITDTAANIANSIDNLKTIAGQIARIDVTDTNPISISAVQLVSDSSVLAKITTSSYTLAITDSSANIASNLDALQASASKITSIAANDTNALAVTLSQVTADATALSKINSGAYTLAVSGVTANGAASTLSGNSKIASISISDTAANIASNLNTLQANVAKITAVTRTDSAALSLSATQVVSDATILSKINSGSYTLAITDSSANIASNLDALQASASKITSIAANDTNALAVTLSQVTADATALSKINSGAYTLAVSGVTANGAASTLSGNSKIASISISDTAANIASNLNTLQANVAKITAMVTSDTSTISITSSQLTADSGALAKLNAGGYSINVTDSQAAANAATLLSTNNKVVSVSITDSSANIASSLNALQTNASHVNSITLSDGTPIAISATQLVNDASVLAKISGGYTLAISDSAANIAANIDALEAAYRAGHLSSIVETGTQAPINITAAQLASDGDVITMLASNNYVYKDLVTFNGANGQLPNANQSGTLTLDSSGNIFGTTFRGGTYGNGTVFELSGANHQQFTTLFNFNATTTGSGPDTNLVFDAAGNLYGTTAGGIGTSLTSDGTIFKLSGPNYQTLTTLVQFVGSNGNYPTHNLLIDSSGNLYGSTSSGGINGAGTVFEVIGANHTSLLNLANYQGGFLVADSAGNIYGSDNGTIFKLSGSPNKALAVLNSTVGSSTLVIGPDGGLYGVSGGGTTASSWGKVFELSGTNFGTLTTLTTFTASNTSNTPTPGANLVFDSAGNLYGTVAWGGANGKGFVFELSGANHQTLTTLYNFTGGAEGGNPNYLNIDSAGNLIGTTYSGGANSLGTVFELSGPNHDIESTITSFTGGSGYWPQIQLSYNGTFFGENAFGGAQGYGTVFQVAKGIQLTVSGVSVANLASTLAISGVSSVSLNDSSAAIAASLDVLQSNVSNISAITTTDSSAISVAASQITSDAGILAKVNGGSYTLSVIGVTAANAATLLSTNNKVVSVSITDSSANIASSLNALQTNASHVNSITLSDGTPIAISATQLVNDASVLAKISGGYTLAISDSAANIAANIDALEAAYRAGHLSSIVETGTQAPINITAAQLASDGDVLALINNGAYTLSVNGVAASNVSSTLANSHVASISVSDSATNLLSNLSTIQSNVGHISGILETGALSNLTIDATQYANNQAAISLIRSGNYAQATLLESASSPSPTLLTDSAGNIYGTTSNSVFEISGGTLANIGNLTGTQNPFQGRTVANLGTGVIGSLAIDSNGNIYGATTSGGYTSYMNGSAGPGYQTWNGGTVFEILASSPGVVNTLVDFYSGAGITPPASSTLSLSHSGNLYIYGNNHVWEITGATTYLAYLNTLPWWQVNPNQSNHYSYTSGVNPSPQTGEVTDTLGNKFGAINVGGTNGYGGVYEVIQGGSTQNLIYSFNSVQGFGVALGGLVKDSAGNLYGLTTGGGANGYGTLYELSGANHEIATVLANFSAGNGTPEGLAIDPLGNLFYTTTNGVYELAAGNFLSLTGLTIAQAISSGGDPNVGSITISDSSANLGSNLDALQVIAAKIGSITATDGGAIAINYSQFIRDHAILSLISNQVAITDSASIIASNLDSLQGNSAKIASIFLSTSDALTLRASQLSSDSAILAKINNGSYSVAVTDAQTVSNGLVLINGYSQISSIAINDTNTAIASNIEALSNQISKIGTIAVSDGTALILGASQFVNNIALLNKIGLGAAIFDTSAAIASNLDGLQNHVSSIASISTADNNPLSITSAQFSGNASVLSFINGGSFTVVITDTQSVASGLSLLNNYPQIASLAITDSSNAIASDLNGLQSNISKIGSITPTDSGHIAINFSQFIGDQAALNLISNQVAITDTSATIANNLNTLQSNVSKIASITASDQNPLSITSAQLNTDSAVLAKVNNGNYTVVVSDAQSISAATALLNSYGQISTLAISDSSATISTNLNSLQSNISKISSITTADNSSLVITYGQISTDASALAKINGGNYTITVSDANAGNALSILASNSKIHGVQVTDTSSAILSNLDNFQAHLNQIASITVSNGEALYVTASQMSADAGILNLIASNGGSYGLFGSNARTGSVSNFLTNASSIPSGSYTISDSTVNIANNIDSLRNNSGKLVAIVTTDNSPLAMSLSQATTNASFLGLINSGSYTLSITGVSAANAPSVLAGNNKIVSVAVSDTANALSGYLSALQSLGNKVASIVVSDSSPLSLTASQFSADSAVLAKISGGNYVVTISDAQTASTALSLLANSKVNNLNISDSSSAIAARIDSLQSNISKIGSIAVTDNNALTVNFAQFNRDQDALNKIANNVAIVDTKIALLSNIDVLQSNLSKVASVTTSDNNVLTLSASQFAADGGVLAKLNNGNYTVAIADTQNAATAVNLLSDSHVSLVRISDSSAAITSNLDALQANFNKTSTISTTDNAVINISASQFVNDLAILGKMSNSVVITDTGSNIAANLNALQANAAKISSINSSDGATLTLTTNQLALDGVVLSKINGGYTLAISDTAVHIASAINTLAANIIANKVATITVSDNGTVYITPEQETIDNAALVMIEAGGGHYSTTPTSGSVSLLGTYANAIPSSSYTVNDTSANVALNLDVLQQYVNKISQFTISDSQPLTLSAGKVSADGDVLRMLPSSYRMAITDSTLNVVNNLAALAANLSHISSINLTDPSGSFNWSTSQFHSNGAVLSKVASVASGNTTVSINDYASNLNNLDLSGYGATKFGLVVTSLDANITENGGHIAKVDLTNLVDATFNTKLVNGGVDTQIDVIASGTAHSILLHGQTPGQVQVAANFSSSINNITAVGLSPDGSTLLINFSSGATAAVPFSSGAGSITLAGSTYQTSNLKDMATAAGNAAPVYIDATGGNTGYLLPTKFAGPASLGLQWQLISNTDNAVITGSSSSEFLKVASANSIGKAVNGGGGNDVIDGGVGSTFVTGGAGHNDTFFLDGRAPGVSWSTITDFKAGSDKATIWGFVKGVSSIDASFTNYNNEGAGGYQGLTLHFKNLLPDGQTAGSNPSLNSITLSGHTLAEFGAVSLADLNNQINNGTNAHFIVGATNDSLGTHGYLQVV